MPVVTAYILLYSYQFFLYRTVAALLKYFSLAAVMIVIIVCEILIT